MIGDLASTDALADQLPPIDELWHFAGLTEFHEDKRALLEQVNIEGTRQALNLAERLGVRRFFHISTAYVCGLATELVPEDALLPAPRFRNPYEETKYHGERLVRDSALPWVVLRPSIIMGHSKTGAVESDKMIYGVIKAYHLVSRLVRREHPDAKTRPKDLVYWVRGRPEVALNLICVDDLVAMLRQARRHAEPGRTYHCVHPEETTLAHLHALTTARLDAPYLRMQPEFPSNPDRKQRLVDRSVRTYADYMLTDPPRFALGNQRQLLNGSRPQAFDQTLLDFLIHRYLADCGEPARQPERVAASLDLSRYPDVRRYGNFSIAYETLARQLDTFRVAGLPGYLAYAQVDTFAILVGDPVSDHGAELLRAFVSWCRQHNWHPCALQIGETTAGQLRELGLAATKMGIETFIDLPNFDPHLRGKRYEPVRNFFNIAQRMGLRIEERPVGAVPVAEIKRVSNAWLATKKNRHELRLLLRPLSLNNEPDVRWFFAFAQNGRLLGFISFNPVWEDNGIIGYSANIERFSLAGQNLPSRFNLVKTISLVAARLFRAEGKRQIALGLSPLHALHDSPFNDDPALLAVFADLAERDDLYAFQGMARHKRDYPDRVERPVFYAGVQEAAGESVLQVLRAVGFL